MVGRDMQDQKAKETKQKSEVISKFNALQKIKMTMKLHKKKTKDKHN